MVHFKAPLVPDDDTEAGPGVEHLIFLRSLKQGHSRDEKDSNTSEAHFLEGGIHGSPEIFSLIYNPRLP